MTGITEVTDKTFKSEVIDSDKTTIVDFWAPWCGPCRMMAPILEEVAKNNEGRIKVCKVNTDENPEAATQYRIMSIPALVIFKNGQEVARSIGVKPAKDLQVELDKIK
jgi:thioredoxin 1